MEGILFSRDLLPSDPTLSFLDEHIVGARSENEVGIATGERRNSVHSLGLGDFQVSTTGEEIFTVAINAGQEMTAFSVETKVSRMQYVDISSLLTLSQSDAAKNLGIPTSTLGKRWKEATKRKWYHVSTISSEYLQAIPNSFQARQRNHNSRQEFRDRVLRTPSK
jgi:hypothetical protein